MKQFYKNWILGTAIAGACGFGLYVYSLTSLPSDLRYIEKATNMRFPSGVSDIKINYPREFCVSGSLKLPQGSVDKYIYNNGYKKQINYPLNSDLGVDSRLFYDLTSLSNWMGRAGRDLSHRWEYAYNPETHIVYFVILFPDMAGDLPP